MFFHHNLVQGSARKGFSVSCSTPLPKSPDRIAECKKPRDCEALNSVTYEQVENPIVGKILTIFFENSKHRVAIIHKIASNWSLFVIAPLRKPLLASILLQAYRSPPHIRCTTGSE